MRLAALLAGTLVLALSGEGGRDTSRCAVNIEYSYYAVSGSTLGEIKRSIRANGPVDPDGKRRYARTDWKIKWSWDRSAAGSIDPGSVHVTCKARVTLPYHERLDALSPEERARWNEYLAILEKHEMNHVLHVEAVAPEISHRIAERQSRAGSVSAKTAQAIAKTVLKEIRQLDRAYDKNTRHGATEGV